MEVMTLGKFESKWRGIFLDLKLDKNLYYKDGNSYIKADKEAGVFLHTRHINKMWYDFREATRKVNRDKFKVSELTIEASKEWWRNKGAVPLTKIAEDFNLTMPLLSAYIEAQIIELANTGSVSNNPSMFEIYYNSFKDKDSDMHFF